MSENNKTTVKSTINFKELIQFKFLPKHITNETILLIKEVTSGNKQLKINTIQQS